MTNAEPADPILAEIHQTRQALLKQHGGVAGLAAFLREQEKHTTREIACPADKQGDQVEQ